MSVALRIKDLCLRVPGRVLISGLSLQADRGEAVAVVGSSGVGKTSLLNAILGMFPIGGGVVEVCGVDVGGGSARQVRELRRRLVGMVFQDSRLLDGLTAAQNVALPARIAGMSAGDALAAARVALAELEVDPDTVAQVLSGGEAQRVALARAVVNRPELILADEPTGSLDSQLRDHVAELLFALPATHKCALVVVTHDPQIAARADTTIKLTPPPTQPDPQH